MDTNTIIEGTVKFRDGKKWKSRWCVMRKLSPVADCLHLQLYKDSRDRYKEGLTKASLSLQHFLGLETGFTLDKESNTIAIICQDLIVVLAFDTRERLIQWQVKIYNHLGEDQHFLIQISSSPLKAKLSPGPAKLHIQERKFCLTAGVPPKLAGCWEMKHLRRYGVVDGKFCFEGGSLCGRGEGLYVFLTDQGDEVTRSFQLASEGKLNSLRRPLMRNMSVQHESPSRKGLMLRTVTRMSEISCADSCLQTQGAIRPNDNAQQWPSMETQTGVYGHGDTSSLADFSIDTLGAKTCNWPGENQIGRCVSCVGKLGLISRPSTAANTPGSMNFNPWAIDESKICLTGIHHNNFVNESEYGCDSSCISISQRSKYSNSSSSGTECSEQPSCQYSSLIENTLKNFQVPISPPKNFQSLTRVDAESPPRRPPKPLKYRNLAESTILIPKERINKPPMPLPLQSDKCSCKSAKYQKEFLQHFDNYDLPKLENSLTSQKIEESNTSQYYDTPRCINVPVTHTSSFANYDIPPAAVPLKNKSTCISTMKITMERQESRSVEICFCHRLQHYPRVCMQPLTHRLSCKNRWPNSIPPKPVHHLIRSTNEGAVYAQVDLTKKTKNRRPGETGNGDAETAEKQNGIENRTNANYTNVRFEGENENYKHLSNLNYMNLEFTNSLTYYENVRELLDKAQQKERVDRLNIDLPAKTSGELRQRIRACHICGHANDTQCTFAATRNAAAALTSNIANRDSSTPTVGAANEKAKSKRIDYVMRSSTENEFENYVPMSPLKLADKLSPEKSASNPILSDFITGGARAKLQRRTSAEAAIYFDYSTTFGSVSRHAARPDRRRSSSASSPEQTADQLMSKDESSCVSSSRRAPTADSDSGLESDKLSQENDDTVESLRHRKGGSGGGCSILAGGVRRLSLGVTGKSSNRNSSSSNDSGFSSVCAKYACQDFNEFEMRSTKAASERRHNSLNRDNRNNGVADEDQCSPIPRRTKSSDPLRDLAFHFYKANVPPKSCSAEAKLPLYLTKRDLCNDCISPSETTTTVPYIDCSTSSGTSDMSDYIETLSISSHSSSDVHSTDAVRMHQRVVSTLKPRSAIEYQKVDRVSLLEVDSKQTS